MPARALDRHGEGGPLGDADAQGLLRRGRRREQQDDEETEDQKPKVTRRVTPTRTPYWSADPASVIGESSASPSRRS